MNLDFSTPTPLLYFASLVQSDEHFPLLEAAASIGQDEDPELDVEQVLGDVDHLLAKLRRRLPKEASTVERLRLLCQFFYKDLGFGGNVNDYYDPANSLLHSVLRKRAGIPISLAILWLELAQSIGLPAQGVGFPGHFLIKLNLPQGQVVIDPFTGQSLSREDLQERLEPFTQRYGLLDEFEAPLGLYLQAATPREIVARVLRNLKEIYQAQEDWPRLLACLNRLVVLLPEAWSEQRDRGLVHAELGDREQAALDLQSYLTHVDDAPDLEFMTQRLHDLRRAVN
jgi:regulator of sirC expression with transglutaminase-like and TPR domain